jgi:hypothetical protein
VVDSVAGFSAYAIVSLVELVGWKSENSSNVHTGAGGCYAGAVDDSYPFWRSRSGLIADPTPALCETISERWDEGLVDEMSEMLRRGVRAAEGAGFENQCARKCTGGSNPPLSVSFQRSIVRPWSVRTSDRGLRAFSGCCPKTVPIRHASCLASVRHARRAAFSNLA